jgi:hypothetical protein
MSANRERLDETIGSTRVAALRGLSALATEDDVSAHSSMAQQ